MDLEKETLILEAYKDGKIVAICDITNLSAEEFVEIIEIQEMLGRTCNLKIEDKL